MREWRKENPDKVRQSNIRYRRTHKYQIKEYMDAYRRQNLEKFNQKSASYYERHKEEIKEKNRQRYWKKKREADIKRNQIRLLVQVHGLEYVRKEGLL